MRLAPDSWMRMMLPKVWRAVDVPHDFQIEQPLFHLF